MDRYQIRTYQAEDIAGAEILQEWWVYPACLRHRKNKVKNIDSQNECAYAFNQYFYIFLSVFFLGLKTTVGTPRYSQLQHPVSPGCPL